MIAAPDVDVARAQPTVVLERRHAVFAAPARGAARTGTVAARRPLTGVRTVLPVLARRDGRVRVRLPGRPNGHSGWIARDGTRVARTPWRLVVETAPRRVTVFRDERRIRAFRAVVGTPSTPTPHGRFFVEETVRLAPGRSGAPFALALSARSTVFDTFDGGPGQVALHGRGSVGGVPGTAASHGCVRLERGAISWLAARIGPGVPVRILRRR